MDNMNVILEVKETGETRKLKFLDGTEMECTQEMAETVLESFSKLDEQNKSMAMFLIDESKNSFTEVMDFLKE